MRRLLALTAALLALAAGGLLWRQTNRPWRPTAPELTTPKLALAQLTGPRTFFPANARAALESSRPALIPEALREAASPLARQLPQATQDPKVFRELDRAVRFEEIWLPGDPSTFKPLLEHLLETTDFTLSYLDHTSLIFRRGAAPWQPAQASAAGAAYAEARERAFFLAQAAVRLALSRRSEAARDYLTQAEASAASVPEVWSGWSTYHMTKGDWPRALEAAERALALEAGFLPGLACRVQCLYATKRFGEAYELSKRLLAASPDDPGLLFYHAKLAHEARAFEAEIAALTRLIALAEAAGTNASGYRVYLGQAWAAKGDADAARDQLTRALLDTTLPREQRKFADELLTQINDRIGKAP
jgi:tetratricopeptide (TPR) repeat protein